MEGAQAEQVAALARQRHVAGYHIRNVVPRHHFVQKLVAEMHEKALLSPAEPRCKINLTIYYTKKTSSNPLFFAKSFLGVTDEVSQKRKARRKAILIIPPRQREGIYLTPG